MLNSNMRILRLLSSFFFIFILTESADAQNELKVKSFMISETDLTARTDVREDANGIPCALVKVIIASSGVAFECGNLASMIVGNVPFRTNEYWVYLASGDGGAKHLKVKHPDYPTIDVHFKDYGFATLEPQATYTLVMELPSDLSIDEAKEIVKGAAKMSLRTYKAHTGIKNVIDIDISVQYPDGESLSDNAIRETINENLGDTYTGHLKDGQSMVLHYANEKLKGEDIEYITSEAKDFGHPFELKDNVYVVFETPKLITMAQESYVFMGGAHGSVSLTYYTVRKSDGRKFGYEILKNTDTPAFKRLLIDGLKPYFTEWSGEAIVTDQQLLNNLQLENDSFDNLRLPMDPEVYITQEYVVIVYDAYEIACGAAGHVESRIPIADIRPYLKTSFLGIIE